MELFFCIAHLQAKSGKTGNFAKRNMKGAGLGTGRFYYGTLPVILLAVLLSGCSSEMEKNRRYGSNQRLEATMPETAIPGTTMPETTMPEIIPDATMPQLTVRTDVDENLQRSNPEILPIGTVAKNVYLGKLNIGGMSQEQLMDRLEKIAAKTDIPMVNAHYDGKTWAIKKQKVGLKLDIDKMIEDALHAGEGETIKYSYLNVKPKITATQLHSRIKQIAKFTTPLLDRDKSRVKNIRLAAKKINHKIVLPGQEFSFNHTTGSRSKRMGYEDATVIVNTPNGPEHKKAPGGGVCQLSTTIYNAVLKCGLKVTERHEHSDEVHYVADGKDATVTYKGADFKFINNRRNPIMIKVYIGKRSVCVKIYENSASNVLKGEQAITS